MLPGRHWGGQKASRILILRILKLMVRNYFLQTCVIEKLQAEGGLSGFIGQRQGNLHNMYSGQRHQHE